MGGQRDPRPHGLRDALQRVLNRLERYVLRWPPRERAASARELQ